MLLVLSIVSGYVSERSFLFLSQWKFWRWYGRWKVLNWRMTQKTCRSVTLSKISLQIWQIDWKCYALLYDGWLKRLIGRNMTQTVSDHLWFDKCFHLMSISFELLLPYCQPKQVQCFPCLSTGIHSVIRKAPTCYHLRWLGYNCKSYCYPCIHQIAIEIINGRYLKWQLDCLHSFHCSRIIHYHSDNRT